MSDRTSKINEAIHECLERCYSAQRPIACMATFLDELRLVETWSMAEIDAVERRVRQILTLIIEQPPSGRVSA
jgi:hypothetical protein